MPVKPVIKKAYEVSKKDEDDVDDVADVLESTDKAHTSSDTRSSTSPTMVTTEVPIAENPIKLVFSACSPV